jgi:hypothetical protein
VTALTDATRAAGGRPGLAPARLAALMEDAVARTRLDLRGAVVLTEAASGPYVVTPLLAALAGADHVVAVTRSSRHGSVAEVGMATDALARLVGVADRVRVKTEALPDDLARADVVTNSGHLRPIDARMIAMMRPDAVVPLMFEAWEVQAGRFDVDLDALRERGIAFAGTNERHPAVDVFSYLGLMAVRQLLDAGVAPYGAAIGLLCDNPFRDHLVRGLAASGAAVEVAATAGELRSAHRLDAVVVALRPRGGPVLTGADAATLGRRWPGVVVAQFWGDLDRAGLAAAGVPCWPALPPAPGHMGVLPSEVGPEPIVRLQAGGLKVGQVLRLPPAARTPADREFLDELG